MHYVTTSQGTTEYLYFRSSLLKEIKYPNNTEAAYTYDAAGRVETIENQQNNATVSSYAYTYDDNGNRKEQSEVNGGATETTTYTYV